MTVINNKIATCTTILLFILVLLIAPTKRAGAQNVGIGTNTPQATLDVKGNQRLGGINHSIGFDSASGKYSWTGSYIWAPAAQYLMMHSASSEGLYYSNAQIEYRNSSGNPVFYTNWSNGNGYFSGKLGIGQNSPQFPLHFSDVTGDKISLYGNTGPHYGFGIQPYLMQIHTDDIASDIAFGYGSSSSFTESMRIKGNGNVGISMLSPAYKLHVGTGTVRIEGPSLPGDKALSLGGYGSIQVDAVGIAGGRLTIADNGYMGIGKSSPAYRLDVAGRMRIGSGGNNGTSAGIWFNNNANAEAAFVGMEDDTHIGLFGAGGAGWKFGMNTQTGALKVNGSEGQAGQVIQSNGAGAAVWASPSNMIYNNMFTYRQTSSVQINNLSGANLPGISGTIVVPTLSKALVSFTAYGTSIGCSFCGSSSISAWIDFDHDINFTYGGSVTAAYASVANGTTTGLGNGFQIITLQPGTYTVTGRAQNSGPTAQVFTGVASVVIIPQ